MSAIFLCLAQVTTPKFLMTDRYAMATLGKKMLIDLLRLDNFPTKTKEMVIRTGAHEVLRGLRRHVKSHHPI